MVTAAGKAQVTSMAPERRHQIAGPDDQETQPLHAGDGPPSPIAGCRASLMLPIFPQRHWARRRLRHIDGTTPGGKRFDQQRAGELPTFDLSVEAWIAAVVSGLLAGTLEEFGWSGVAFPALLGRFGLLLAGTATGVIVALWHLPLFFISTQPQSTFSFLSFLLTLIAVRVLFGWVYLGAGGSVLLCVLFHASGNAWSEVLSVPRPDFTAAWLAEPPYSRFPPLRFGCSGGTPDPGIPGRPRPPSTTRSNR
jgi:Type II CAAX prenyl endopeptidase Rce1-like